MMITPLTEKLELKGFASPHWKVDGQKFYSKYHAIKRCREIGYKWPSYHVWGEPLSFRRPKLTFEQSVDRQCEIVSDSYKKVRLFYSGGRDSHLILHHMLRNKHKLDEIAIYRRFPGVVDKVTNEFDQFNLISVLNKILNSYDTKVEVRFYDLMPEHFNYYSTRLETLYFPYTALEFFPNGVHTLAEWFPHLLDHNWVNILGHAMPDVHENLFYWVDTSTNMTQSDPYTLHFFADQRNTDLTVNLAYTIYDVSRKTKDRQYSRQDGLQIKDRLNFPNTGTPLDTKWDGFDSATNVYRWFLSPKEMFYAANALKSDIGRQTYFNMIKFYEQTELKYQSYFENGSIYNIWIGGVSEKHTLLDV